MTFKTSMFDKTFWITLFWKQNKYHVHGVFVHTMRVLYNVIKYRDYKFIAAAIFHDIGKPFSAYQKEEDIINKEYSFTDHEEYSYQIVKNWFFLSNWTKDVIRYHYIIRDIKKCKKKNDLKRLEKKETIFKTFDENFIQDLEKFLIYDDLGKGR